MVEVVATDEFASWYRSLDDRDGDAVDVIVDLLADQGVRLGHPYSSAILGASVALRELRTKSDGSVIRIFYAFDPVRAAVLIIGGDKRGDDRFYERMVPLAEKIWKRYLEEQKQEQKP